MNEIKEFNFICGTCYYYIRESFPECYDLDYYNPSCEKFRRRSGDIRAENREFS